MAEETIPGTTTTAVAEKPDAPTTQVATQTEKPPEVDYKAQYETERTARVKAENDARAEAGRRRAESARLDALQRSIGIIGKAVSPETEAALEAENVTVRQEAQKTAYADGYTALRNKLDVVTKGVLDPNTSPLVAEARQAWIESYNRGDLIGVAAALADISLVVAEERDKSRTTAHAKELVTARADAKKEAEKALGAFDTTGGRSAGGAGTLPLSELVKQDTRKMSPKQLRDHNAALNAAAGLR